MPPRTDEDYEIEALTKGIAVLEALEGTAFEPVSASRIEQRTGFSRDLVMRTLRTLRIRGYVVQTERGLWMIGPRMMRFANSVDMAFPELREKFEKLRAA